MRKSNDGKSNATGGKKVLLSVLSYHLSAAENLGATENLRTGES